MQVTCATCSRPIAPNDFIESSAGRLSHVDCARPQGLTPEERALLFVYCSDHIVAKCLWCVAGFRMTELAADPLGGRTNLCPQCGKDLTQSVRAHVFACAVPPSEIQQRAQEVRDAAQILIKRSKELSDQSYVLIREAEARLFERQQALRAAMASRARS